MKQLNSGTGAAGKSVTGGQWHGSVFLHLTLIGLLGLLAYCNTFHAPFQWDESAFISNNPIVKDMGYFLDLSRAKSFEFYDAVRNRYVGYLTFALNYRLGGLEVAGYHDVNLAIHILNAFLAYILVLITFRTPFLKGSPLGGRARWIALLSALLFVAHPVQTEAVTYVFQRLASLAAFFYLLSLAAYAGWRLEPSGGYRKYALYGASLVSAALAMKTKESAFTLPIVAALYELLFFSGPARRRVLGLLPLLLTLPIVPLSIAGTDKPAGDIISGMASATRGFSGITRADYLFTQFRVIVTYMRLLFLPVGQNLEYDYPLYHSLFQPQVFFSLLLLLAVASGALYLIYRSRSRLPETRLMGFGVLWFFVALSVESSVIPIQVVIDEYRVYLPSVGVFWAVSAGVFLMAARFGRSKMAKAVAVPLIAVPLVLACATYERNSVWAGRASLWEDVVRKSPALPYPHVNLGKIYMEMGRPEEAARQFRAAIRLKPDHVSAYSNLGMLYAVMGRTGDAIEELEAAVRIDPGYAKARVNLGALYAQMGRLDEAELELRTAITIRPEEPDAHNNLGIIYMERGSLEEAKREFQAAMRLDPDYAKAPYNLGLIYERQGLTGEAIEAFRTALRIDPGYARARRKLEELYGGQESFDKSTTEARRN